MFMPTERSPSPEPTYGHDGKRNNTRDVRYRQRAEKELHRLVRLAKKKHPGFVPPITYRAPTKFQDKLYIPQDEFPNVVFMGQILGPRGETVQKIREETGTEISIQGKGSDKDGKRGRDRRGGGASEEKMHCLILADSEEKIAAAKERLKHIIEVVCYFHFIMFLHLHHSLILILRLLLHPMNPTHSRCNS